MILNFIVEMAFDYLLILGFVTCTIPAVTCRIKLVHYFVSFYLFGRNLDLYLGGDIKNRR